MDYTHFPIGGYKANVMWLPPILSPFPCPGILEQTGNWYLSSPLIEAKWYDRMALCVFFSSETIKDYERLKAREVTWPFLTRLPLHQPTILSGWGCWRRPEYLFCDLLLPWWWWWCWWWWVWSSYYDICYSLDLPSSLQIEIASQWWCWFFYDWDNGDNFWMVRGGEQ